MTTIYVIEPREVLLRAALRAGVDVVPLVAAERAETSVPGVVVDTTDPVAIAGLIASRRADHGLGSICMGPTDQSGLTAAAVNESLGLRMGGFFDGASLRRMLDKAETRRGVDASCPELDLNPRWCVAQTREDAIRFFVAAPVVVKPLTGSGSRGVHVVGDEASLRALNRRSFPAIVEEKVEGREFSIETMSFEGHHHTLAITHKTTGGSSGVVEVQHAQPADLTPRLEQSVGVAAGRTLTAVGQTDGLSHTEVIVTSGGIVKLIETHARAGGDMIVDMLRTTVGLNAYEVLFQTIAESRVPNVQPTGVHARIFFPNLQHTHLPLGAIAGRLYRKPAVRLVRFLKPRTAWGPVSNSGDRHCVVMAEGSLSDLKEVSAVLGGLEKPKALFDSNGS